MELLYLQVNTLSLYLYELIALEGDFVDDCFTGDTLILVSQRVTISCYTNRYIYLT